MGKALAANMKIFQSFDSILSGIGIGAIWSLASICRTGNKIVHLNSCMHDVYQIRLKIRWLGMTGKCGIHASSLVVYWDRKGNKAKGA